MISRFTTAIVAFAALVLGVGIGASLSNPTLVTVVGDWMTALTALAALAVAVATIERQRHESLLQRQMQTVQVQNKIYDDLFNDIFVLRSKGAASAEEVRAIYSRYFVAIMSGVRHYKADLVPRSDFVEWTAILLSRFYKDKCLIDFEGQGGDNTLLKQWKFFDDNMYGPKVAFRRYMADLRARAAELPAGLSDEDRHKACGRAAEDAVARLDTQ